MFNYGAGGPMFHGKCVQVYPQLLFSKKAEDFLWGTIDFLCRIPPKVNLLLKMATSTFLLRRNCELDIILDMSKEYFCLENRGTPAP